MVEISNVAVVIAVALIFLVLMQLSTLEKRVASLSNLNYKLDALLEHAGIAYDPFEDVPEGVVQAIQDGKKILAIKQYRAATGVGLKEAKEFVEEIERRAGQ